MSLYYSDPFPLRRNTHHPPPSPPPHTPLPRPMTRQDAPGTAETRRPTCHVTQPTWNTPTRRNDPQEVENTRNGASEGTGEGRENTGREWAGVQRYACNFFILLTILLTIINSTPPSLCAEHKDTPVWACLCVWHPSPPVRHVADTHLGVCYMSLTPNTMKTPKRRFHRVWCLPHLPNETNTPSSACSLCWAPPLYSNM